MFNIGKNKDNDPKKALKNASDKLNKGLTGGLTKAFMGKDFMDQTNAALETASQVLDTSEMQATLMQSGMDATAEVLSIQDTGQTVNMNPVVALTLNVTPAAGEAFQTSGQIMISRLTVPRVGETVNIKFDPKNKSHFTIV